jgi:glutamate--cysteine ligase
MPTQDRREALTLDDAIRRSGERAFPNAADSARSMRVGLEPEFFPIFVDTGGRPAGRVPLRDPSGRAVLEIIDGLACGETLIGSRAGGPLGPWRYDLSDGGRLTFEPGAQVEHSTAVYPNVAAALAGVDEMLALLRPAFRPHGAVLAAAGVDIWHDVDEVPQQLPFGRYTAQAEYYDRRGPWGRVMMRHSASVQINLDLGPDGIWQERWLAANLVSPLITATFACSPGAEAVSTRARAWQQLDPTRSGFPPRLIEWEEPDPRTEWAAAALSADVMLFRLGDGRWEPGTPGFNFSRWISDGHPDHGWPTVADLDYHLTTLFFEVRPRGFIELRGGEAVPDWMRVAQVVSLASVIYEDTARRAVLDLMLPQRRRLLELWHRAALHGVHDPELAELAAAVWEESLRGAELLGVEYLGPEAVAVTRRFHERFSFQGRTPSDELRELFAEDPGASLAWACSEPAA